MAWNPSHIFWQEQVLLLWILLPPVFISSILLGLFSPRLFATVKKEPETAPKDLSASADAIPSR
jgi:hypothetical protein